MSDDIKQTIQKLQDLLEEGVLTPEEYLSSMQSVLAAHEASSDASDQDGSSTEILDQIATDELSDDTLAQPEAIEVPTQAEAVAQTIIQPIVGESQYEIPATQSSIQATSQKSTKKRGVGFWIVIAIIAVLLISIIGGNGRNANNVGKSKSSSDTSSVATEPEHVHEWVAATCTEAEHCETCGEVNGEPLGHDVEEWTVTQEATCQSTGLATGTCKTCGEEIEYEVPKKDHAPGDWFIASNYTITEDGNVKPGYYAQKCTVCGEIVDYSTYTITLTASQKNAIRQAHSYLNFMAFSYSGLVDQLEFEGYSHDDAVFAVDNCGADWYEQAAKKAESYNEFMAFSRSGLIDQLEFEGFTYDEAVYGVNAIGL